MRQVISRCGLAFFVLCLALLTAQAQDYPTKPIRIIVPVPPGGGVDVAARIFSQKLGDILGQQIAIEYRPGASGMVGAQTVARSAPDGYTLLFYADDLLTIPSLLPHADIDTNKELLPITTVSSNPLLVVASANAPFSTVKEMLDTAKASPSGLAYAVPGQASMNNVIAQWIAVAAHVKLLPVPYRGGPEAVLGIASGDVQLGILSAPAVYPALVNAGKIKVIALSGSRRPAFLPSSWPTLAESGLPIDVSLGLGIFGPVGMPAAVVARIDRAMKEVLEDDTVRKRMNDAGISPEYIGQAAFAARIRTEASQYSEIIRLTGIRSD
jgi:tripartite-type tricarboxylate transporter receptor subunit TctC